MWLLFLLFIAILKLATVYLKPWNCSYCTAGEVLFSINFVHIASYVIFVKKKKIHIGHISNYFRQLETILELYYLTCHRFLINFGTALFNFVCLCAFADERGIMLCLKEYSFHFRILCIYYCKKKWEKELP